MATQKPDRLDVADRGTSGRSSNKPEGTGSVPPIRTSSSTEPSEVTLGRDSSSARSGEEPSSRSATLAAETSGSPETLGDSSTRRKVEPSQSDTRDTKTRDDGLNFPSPRELPGRDGQSARPEASMRLESLEELREREQEILRAIELLPNGGMRFLAHPLRCIEDAGFELSPQLQRVLLNEMPEVETRTPTSYTTWKTLNPSRVRRVRLTGLFRSTAKGGRQ